MELRAQVIAEVMQTPKELNDEDLGVLLNHHPAEIRRVVDSLCEKDCKEFGEKVFIAADRNGRYFMTPIEEST